MPLSITQSSGNDVSSPQKGVWYRKVYPVYLPSFGALGTNATTIKVLHPDTGVDYFKLDEDLLPRCQMSLSIYHRDVNPGYISGALRLRGSCFGQWKEAIISGGTSTETARQSVLLPTYYANDTTTDPSNFDNSLVYTYGTNTSDTAVKSNISNGTQEILTYPETRDILTVNGYIRLRFTLICRGVSDARLVEAVVEYMHVTDPLDNYIPR